MFLSHNFLSHDLFCPTIFWLTIFLPHKRWSRDFPRHCLHLPTRSHLSVANVKVFVVLAWGKKAQSVTLLQQLAPPSEQERKQNQWISDQSTRVPTSSQVGVSIAPPPLSATTWVEAIITSLLHRRFNSNLFPAAAAERWHKLAVVAVSTLHTTWTRKLLYYSHPDGRKKPAIVGS